MRRARAPTRAGLVQQVLLGPGRSLRVVLLGSEALLHGFALQVIVEMTEWGCDYT